MPRLSLYRPQKSQDYKFIDRTIYEMFQVGGVDVYLHKYIGPVDPSDPSKAMGETTIQDVLFLENRDRKYETDVYTIRGHYQLQDLDFNLSQFGLFLQNDTVFMTIHINNSVDLIGRKIMSGDVLELPNLAEEYVLDRTDLSNVQRAIKKYYVVEDVTRAAEGFSATWYPHLYRLKLKPLVASQEFRDILVRPEDSDIYAGDWTEFEEDGITPKLYYPGQVVKFEGTLYQVKTDGSVPDTGTNISPPDSAAWIVYTGNSLQDLFSTYNRELEINNAVIAEAESDAPLSGFDTRHYYTVAVDQTTGEVLLDTIDEAGATVKATPIREGYTGYLMGDGVPPNGEQFGFGIKFPERPVSGDFFLRTDYLPNRLFRFNGSKWIKYEDNVRMTMTNTTSTSHDVRNTYKTSFINNINKTYLDGVAVDTFVAKSDYTFNAEDPTNFTTSFNLATGEVITTIDYNQSYAVRATVGEYSTATVTNIINVGGKVGFTINVPGGIPVNDRITWGIFNKVVDQKQSLSKAIGTRARFRPQADE